MAHSSDQRPFAYQLHHQSKPVGLVRWLPSAASPPFHRLAALSVPSLSTLEIHSYGYSSSSSSSSAAPHSSLDLVSSHSLPSPATALCSRSPLLAAATSAGSLHFYSLDPSQATVQQLFSLADRDSFHSASIRAIDVRTTSASPLAEAECATAGEDGRLNLVSLGQDRVDNLRVCDSDGLVAYTAVRWASPVEFVTAAVGPGLQCWDRRSPEGPVAAAHSPARGFVTGLIHSIDIHPSRKHTCVVGGSSGTVYAWDLRWPQQAITLAGTGTGHDAKSQPLSASEVWEVKYDAFTPQISSTKVLPVMMCSEDGFLAVLHQDESPVQLLEEPCAINSFDIDPQNPSDVIVALEWESVGILSRGREEVEMT